MRLYSTTPHGTFLVLSVVSSRATSSATTITVLDARGAQSSRFNNTTGVIGYVSSLGRTPGSYHPDRCICQGDDSTPHKHYPEKPYACARCRCTFYSPVKPDA